MRSQTVTFLIGISGSGKSTLAKKLAKETGAKIVSRDYIRQGLFGYSDEDIHEYYTHRDLNKNESIVTRIHYDMINRLIDDGEDVIIDNTNLVLGYIEKIRYDVESIRTAKFKYILCDTIVEDCILRDTQRSRSVGNIVILKQKGQLDTLMQKIFENNIPLEIAKIS